MDLYLRYFYHMVDKRVYGPPGTVFTEAHSNHEMIAAVRHEVNVSITL